VKKTKTKAPRRASPSGLPKPVEAALAVYPSPVRAALLKLRKIITGTAAKMDGIGTLEETLKWSQPAYLAKGGSTIRIDAVKDDPKRVAMYFICTTDLIATFRDLYPDLSYEGNRAILLDVRKKLPEDALRHCVSLALTYKTRK
jgi:hypothetical protein